MLTTRITYYGYTALSLAASARCVEAVKLLLERDDIDINLHDTCRTVGHGPRSTRHAIHSAWK